MIAERPRIWEQPLVREHTISLDEFTARTTAIVLAPSLSGIVTRDSYIYFLMDGFRASSGSIFRHLVYCDWYQVNTGFNYRDATKNFLQAGGWNCLSSEEQQVFLKAHQRVKVKEHQRVTNSRSHREFVVGFNGFVGNLSDEEDYYYLAVPLEALRGMPETELIARAETFVNRKKVSGREESE